MKHKAKWLTDIQVIELIDYLLSCDLTEELEMQLAFHPKEMTPSEREAARLLGNLYMISHSHNKKNCCYHVHGDWRAYGAKRFKCMLRELDAAKPGRKLAKKATLEGKRG